MAQELQIQVTVETVTFENPDNGFAVIAVADESGDLFCAVGPLAGSVPGEELTLTGHYTEHATYGLQFEVQACSYRMPETESSILKYLGSGVLPGIGAATARRIVKQFGEQSLEILATEPEKLASIKGLSMQKAKKAGERFLELFDIREATASLARLGLQSMEAIAVYRHYGKITLDIIRENPYCLCGPPLNISFARADAIAGQFSLDKTSSQRTRAALLYTLRHNTQNGHTCVPRDKLIATVSSFFAIDPERAGNELDILAQGDSIQEVTEDGVTFVYLGEMLRAELMAALRLRALAGRTFSPPDSLEQQIAYRELAEGIQYAPLQKRAIEMALSHGAMVITGGPGTGKTTTINAIIALFEQQAERVFLAAPTGRAAKRLTELTGRAASTIHRTLEADFRHGGDTPFFARNEKNPLRCDVLVVDEMSMVDALLFDNLLAALRPGSRLIMVGDADQLPSVGAGNVLRGILQSGVIPVVSLKKIFRQAASSLIVSNAHRIVAGENPLNGKKQDDFFFLKAGGQGAQDLVCDLVAKRLVESYGFSPLTDIQVLCPGRKGPLGTEQLGARLQQIINPPQPEKPEIARTGIVFRLGDKVMQIKNNYDLPFTRPDGETGEGVFNGDIGIIEEVNPRAGTLSVLCEDRHVHYGPEDLKELELAYAITIHKSQGSEFEAVVIPVTEVPRKLRYRNLLYTGVTRAKQLCVLVGEPPIVEEMVANKHRNTRFSCFHYFLQDEDLL